MSATMKPISGKGNPGLRRFARNFPLHCPKAGSIVIQMTPTLAFVIPARAGMTGYGFVQDHHIPYRGQENVA
ncbi:MAG: hypothetical protein ACC634_06530 [Hyphomicrobiales bacterium]